MLVRFDELIILDKKYSGNALERKKENYSKKKPYPKIELFKRTDILM